jgi:uncharacterized protein YhhL (DUF1145 family)
MISLLKAACLVIYAIALAGFAGLSSGGLAATMQVVAATLLAAHVLEIAFLFKHVRRYRGALAVSVLLTLLFGLLHLRPLSMQTPSIAN